MLQRINVISFDKFAMLNPNVHKTANLAHRVMLAVHN